MVVCSFKPTPGEVEAAERLKARVGNGTVISMHRVPFRWVEYYWVDLKSDRIGIATYDGAGRWSRRHGELPSEEDPTPPAGSVLFRVVLS